ncbi:MAG: hypothetical protein IE889_03120 [Campylobacterales bacterium]|nr:hypothetical protein [Campylobacterales bacterium]
MFSFINLLQSLANRMKKNKGLWFTMLTLLSTVGIILSMFLINYMSSNVAHKIYMKIHRVNATHLENILDQKYDTLLSISDILAIQPEIAANIKSKSDKSINNYLESVQTTINKTLGSDPVLVHYYAKDFTATKSENFKYANIVMASQTSISGIVVNKIGTRIIVMTPVMDNNETIGVIELSQDISSVKNDFAKFGKDFVFLIDKSQLPFIDLSFKQGMLEDINEQLKIFFHQYDAGFYTYLTHIDFVQLNQDKFHVDKSYYIDTTEALDIDGKNIGQFVIGERGAQEDSFVTITQDLIKSVTTVALGLVISLILFMF